MTVHFRKKDRTLESAVRRIACAEIDAAIAAIDAPDMTAEKKVHAVRKQCKALRALIRLVRPAFDGFAEMDALFRGIARPLSVARDAKVMVDTFDALVESAGDRLDGLDLAAIRARLCAAQDRDADDAAALAICRAELVEARAHARRWTLNDVGWAAIAGGLERTYRRARRAMKHVAQEADAAASHEWRRHAKYHWHHARLLRPIRPHALRGREKKANSLGDLLGERHDLDVLLEALAEAPERFGGKEAAERLVQVATRQAVRFDERALRLGTELFDEKPGKLAAQWGEWWADWRQAAA